MKKSTEQKSILLFFKDKEGNPYTEDVKLKKNRRMKKKKIAIKSNQTDILSLINNSRYGTPIRFFHLEKTKKTIDVGKENSDREIIKIYNDDEKLLRFIPKFIRQDYSPLFYAVPNPNKKIENKILARIVYCVEDDSVHAFDRKTKKKIGHLCISDEWLDSVEVDEKYQANGIGSSMVKLMLQVTDFMFPSYGQSGIHEYYLSLEGAALMNSCFRKGIICEEHIPDYDSELIPLTDDGHSYTP